jgi:hypothetical protein
MNITQIKNILDNYFATYSNIPTHISTYASSIYYEIYVKSVRSQDFSNRMKWTGVKIFEISPYENNLILIRFFVNTKTLEKLLSGID